MSSGMDKYSRFDAPARAENVFLKGARVVDPRQGIDQILNLHVRQGILQVGAAEAPAGADTVDLQGHLITPGWFDLHVHFREPGREVAETVASGCQAASNGGFTGVACMPNTDPPLDSAGLVQWVAEQGSRFPVDVNVVACVTRGRAGKELVDMSELYDAGVRAFSDDGSAVRNSGVLRSALEYANMIGARIFEHADDTYLSSDGSMNEGEWSTRLGLSGIPTVGEVIDVMRCILLAKYCDAAVHICHVSTKGAIDWIRWAKQNGIRVTAEVCPHHLLLTDEACRTFDANTKMNPPLRTEVDRLACLEGFRDGTLDVYCTDHAPHPWEAKAQEFDTAPFGIVGIETALSLALTHLMPSVVDLPTLLDRVVYAPREVLSQSIPTIASGQPANLTIIDPQASYHVDPSSFRSQSRNTPFDGWPVKGRARGVINRGFAVIKPAFA